MVYFIATGPHENVWLTRRLFWLSFVHMDIAKHGVPQVPKSEINPSIHQPINPSTARRITSTSHKHKQIHSRGADSTTGTGHGAIMTLSVAVMRDSHVALDPTMDLGLVIASDSSTK